MTTIEIAAGDAVKTVLGAATSTRIRPRYEGSNICTWIGFKHVNYLLEEAVLGHLREGGLGPGALFETYRLGVDLVDLDTRILTAFHIDDVAIAEVVPATSDGDDEMIFAVTLYVDGPTPVKAVSATARVVLRHDPGKSAEAVPVSLLRFVTGAIDRTGKVPGISAPPAVVAGAGADQVLAGLASGGNSIVWRWRIPYFYCHFTRRVQMSGYLRLMEEAVDLLLAERGVSIWRLLDEQDWIPVVPHSRVTLLDEALMEEEVYTVLTVENVFKRLTYTSRMDCYVVRDGELVQTATGRITHGYAVIENQRDWSLVDFDDRLLRALDGGQVEGRGAIASSPGRP